MIRSFANIAKESLRSVRPYNTYGHKKNLRNLSTVRLVRDDVDRCDVDRGDVDRVDVDRGDVDQDDVNRDSSDSRTASMRPKDIYMT